MTTPINMMIELMKTHIRYAEPNSPQLDILLKLHAEACELLKYERDVMTLVFYDGEKNQFNINRDVKYYETANSYIHERFR